MDLSLTCAKSDDDGFILQAQLTSKLTGDEHKIKKRLVLVIDTSGSMGPVMPQVQPSFALHCV